MDDARGPGSVALVTGATSGIGRMIALHLAAQGSPVAGVGRNAAGLAALEADARDQSGEVLGIQADVTASDSVRNALEQAEERWGPVELVIACAGVADALGPVVEVAAAEWWKDVTTDLLGTFLTLQESARRMQPRRRGRLISVYGNLGDRGTPNLSAFAASKAAVARLSECLASELGPVGVKVFCMHPGFVRTPMTEALAWGDAGQRFLPGFGERAEEHWGDGREALALVDAIRDGNADELTGRLLFAGDDLASLTEQASSSPDLRRLRISFETQ